MTLRTTLAAGAVCLLLAGCQGGPFNGDNSNAITASNTYAGSAPDSRTASTAVPEYKPMAMTGNAGRKPLVVSDTPAPTVIYERGSRDTIMASGDTEAALKLPSYNDQNVETLVTRKVASLNRDLAALRQTSGSYKARLEALQAKSDTQAAQYYELVAAINTELQAGNTPGNPVLIQRWNVAQSKLDDLSESARYLNQLATDLSDEASKAAYLQENVRGAYGLSGAVKSDHVKLRALEDGVNQQIIDLNRQLTSVSDEISRRTAYLRSERANMQTLSLAITNGELYGQNIANSLYSRATQTSANFYPPSAKPAQRRPLIVIRFDRPGVNYQQPLYTAVNQALQKFPAAKFDLVAVSTSHGNPAEVALASSEARKNGEAVLRSLTQMGLPVERINLNAANSADVRNSEVQLYLK
ncbi:MAG: hypothetical protein GC185_12910 [Alphaproteobacteria bacterium]|nr:hypothetical protein [Alphaproteobacteria bacterium]